MEKIILLGQIASTLIMTGVIWIIQLIQYPLFKFIDRADYQNYHLAHKFWITPIVAPAMIAELLTSILIVFYPPPALNLKIFYAGLILTLIIWASTFFIQIPLHEKLSAGFDENAHKLLVTTNWIRTAAWTFRSILILYVAWRVIEV